ncbi:MULTISPECIES: hypothetical protein [Tenacibaculum]|uniref:hypothetical protein n=1 Tax=Tenacibaculum TaxID=104267 RepID=UPI001F0B564A|nr:MULTISPECIES: hypothetical protein [Tenacibaculum]MCH3882801.1 hypothetical protein [Tenacibaculum aquimarinum]MDO6600489.1 hypothetical protein [Tenacibaculum sp. 1_MG-2023]
MKRNVLIIVLLVAQFFCTSIFSQEEITPSYFSSTSSNKNTPEILFNSSNNYLVDVVQIQTTNSVNSVVLNQKGLYNVADISQSNLTSQAVTQLGNKNYYSFNNYNNTSPVNLSVLQQGNANSLQIYGTNSFMDGLKIVQKSNFKNIVIKNYK